MKRCLRILSLLVALCFGVVQLLEYHHHDCSGKIFFSFSSDSEIAFDSGIEKCHHHCDHRSHRHESEEECPMHLDISLNFRADSDISQGNVCCLDMTAVLAGCAFAPMSCDRQVESVLVAGDDDRLLSIPIFHCPRRGPPSLA